MRNNNDIEFSNHTVEAARDFISEIIKDGNVNEDKSKEFVKSLNDDLAASSLSIIQFKSEEINIVYGSLVSVFKKQPGLVNFIRNKKDIIQDSFRSSINTMLYGKPENNMA